MPVVVTGDEAFEAKLKAFQAKGELERAYDDSGAFVARMASGLAPVKSGTLRESIRHSPGTNSSTKRKVQAGDRGFPYAPIIHYANFQNPPRKAQPFLTKALAIANASYVEVRFDAEMKEAMRVTGL